MATAAVFAAIAASSAFSAFSSITQGQAMKNMAEANAELAIEQGKSQDRLAQIEAGRVKREGQRFAGQVEAAIGSNTGFSGSALGVLSDLAREQELDVRLTKLQGTLAREAGETEARFERFRGREAVRQGRFGAIGSILGGGRKAATFQAGRG